MCDLHRICKHCNRWNLWIPRWQHRTIELQLFWRDPRHMTYFNIPSIHVDCLFKENKAFAPVRFLSPGCVEKKHYFNSRSLARNYHKTFELHIVLQTANGRDRHIRLGTNFLHYTNTTVTTTPTPTTTISTAEASRITITYLSTRIFHSKPRMNFKDTLGQATISCTTPIQQ